MISKEQEIVSAIKQLTREVALLNQTIAKVNHTEACGHKKMW